MTVFKEGARNTVALLSGVGRNMNTSEGEVIIPVMYGVLLNVPDMC